jgi:hypothetical protein
VRYIKRAGMVTIVLDPVDGSGKTGDTLLSIPASYRPSDTVRSVAWKSGQDNISLSAFDTGSIICTGSGTMIRGSITYPVIT